MRESAGNDPVGDFAASVKDYAQVQLEIVKLEAASSFSGFVAKISSGLLLTLIAVLFFLLLTAAVAIYLGQAMGNMALGFLTLAGIYLLLLIILGVFREALIRRPIRNRIISALLNNSPQHEFSDSNKQ